MNTRLKFFLFLTIFVVSFLVRYFLILDHKAVSGGDAYNFLFIAGRLSNFQNPFEAARRLPVYPLFLIPGHLSKIIDPILWGRLVSSASGALAVSFVFLIADALGLGLMFSLCAALFASFNFSFLSVSLRPLAHSLYAFLLMLSIFVALKKPTVKNLLLLGFLCGLMSMTRHEGMAATAVIIMFKGFEILKSKKLANFLVLGLPVMFLIAPYFVYNMLAFGNPLYSDYTNDPALPAARNLNAFVLNLKSTYLNILGLWVGREHFGLAILALVFTLIGIYKIILNKTQNGFLVLIVLLTQLILSVLLQPSLRYWHQFLPLLALFLLLGIKSFSEAVDKGLVVKVLTYIFTLVFFCLVARRSFSAVKTDIARNNIVNEFDYLLRDGVNYLLDKDGVVGFASDFPYAIYKFGQTKGAYYTIRPPKIDSMEVQRKWLQKNHVRYFVWDSEHPYVTYFLESNSVPIMTFEGQKTSVRIFKVDE